MPIAVDELDSIPASRVDRKLLERLRGDDGPLAGYTRPMVERDG